MRRLSFDDRDALAAVVGADAAADPAVLDALRDADRELRAFAGEHEGFSTDGLTVYAYPGPPAVHDLAGFVESDELTFWVELSRGDEGTSRAFAVEAEVYAEGQKRIAELDPAEHDDAREAARALLAAVAKLRREAEVLTRRP